MSVKLVLARHVTTEVPNPSIDRTANGGRRFASALASSLLSVPAPGKGVLDD